MLKHRAGPFPGEKTSEQDEAPCHDRGEASLQHVPEVRLLEEIRCGRCSRKLAVAEYRELQIKCPRCGALNHLRAASPEPERRRASEQEQTHAHDHES